MRDSPTVTTFGWFVKFQVLMGSALLLAGLGATVSACKRAEAHALRLPAAFDGVALADQSGKAVGGPELGGTTLLVSFMFTSCPSVCPKQTQALAQVQRSLPADVRERVRFLSISVDPETDTPEKLREFALKNGAELASWSFVRGSAEGTRTLSERLHAFDAAGNTAPSAHTTAAYLFDARGNLLQRYGGGAIDVTRLTREIERVDEMSRAGNAK